MVKTKRTNLPVRKSSLPQEYQNEINRSDVSIHPSYTNLVKPYDVMCRERYRKTEQIYQKQFISELINQEMLQFFAIDGVRLHRQFVDRILDYGKFQKRSFEHIQRIDNIIKN